MSQPFPGNQTVSPNQEDHWKLFLQQLNFDYLNLCQYCQAKHSVEKWIELQNDLKAKLDYVTRTISYYPAPSSLLFDKEPSTSQKKLEQIKKEIQQESFPIPKKFKFRPDAPVFIPSTFTPPPGIDGPISSISKSADSKSQPKSFAAVAVKNTFSPQPQIIAPKPSPSLMSWASSNVSPIRDEWDDDSFRDEINKAHEQIWAETEAWLDAQDAAEEEEWRILISKAEGANGAKFSSSLNLGDNPAILDSLFVETSFDQLIEHLIDDGDDISPINDDENRYQTPNKIDLDEMSSSPSYSMKSKPARSLHEKLSSPDRKKALSPTEARKKYEAKLLAAINNRDKNVAEKIQKAMVASNRIKALSIKEQKRKAEASEALQEKLREAELRHSAKINKIKGKAGSEIAKVSEALVINTQNSEVLQHHLQQKFKEVEAKILAAAQRREQRLEMISGSQRKKNSRKSQQMSEFRLQLEKEKMERWEKLQKRFEAVQDRRKKRLEDLKKRAEVESHSSTPYLSNLTLVDDAKLAKTLQSYSPKVILHSDHPLSLQNVAQEETNNVHDLSPNKSSRHESYPPSPVHDNLSQKSAPIPVVLLPEKDIKEANSLSFDPNEESHSSIAPQIKSNIPDYDSAISHSEEIEFVLFPAVAKSHARFIELINRAKIVTSRNNTFTLSLKCLENNKDFLSHQFYSILHNEHSNASRNGSNNSSPVIKESKSRFSPTEHGDEKKFNSPFHQLIENIEESKRSIHSEERGASSYNIYASIIKDIRVFGINCNIDLAEKINFLVINLLDSWKGKIINSVGIDDFIRSGGMLLLPVLISYEYGVLSDLSSIQNFMNSLVVFSRNSYSLSRKSSFSDELPKLGINSGSNNCNLPPEIVRFNHYKDSILLHLAHAQHQSAHTSNQHSNPLSSVIQQIDFCALIDLFSLIICDYTIDASILFGLSLNVTLLDLCLFLHYLLSSVSIENSSNGTHSPIPVHSGIADGNTMAITGDIVYRYSLSVIRLKTGRIIQLIAKVLDSTVEAILKYYSTNSSEKAETPSSQRIDLLFDALFTFQQHSFQCAFMNSIYDQTKLQLANLQSSLTFFHSPLLVASVDQTIPKNSTQNSLKPPLNHHNPSTTTQSNQPLLQFYSILEEFPSHFGYFDSIVSYTISIAKFLHLLQTGKERNPIEFTKHQQIIKHWISQLRRNSVMKLIIETFYFGYDCLFLLLDFPSLNLSESLFALMKENILSTTIIFKLINHAFEAIILLIQVESDLFKQLSSHEKGQLIEKMTNYFIFIVFILDKSKDIKEILHLRNKENPHFPAASMSIANEIISFISTEFRDSYELYELSLQKLTYLLSKLVYYDYEFRKMIGESCEKRIADSSNSTNSNTGSSDLFEDISKNKIIHLILIYGTNQNVNHINNNNNEDSSSSNNAATIDPSKALLLRQKLCFLQMICLLSVKYYKDLKLKPILLALLMISSIESELNGQIIQFYKKDKLIQKHLTHYFKEKEDFLLLESIKDTEKETYEKKAEKLKQFHELVPENVMETLKMKWISSNKT